MATQAKGTFEVKVTPLAQEENVGDPTVGRLSLDKQFHGDLEAGSKGQMLAVGSGAPGASAGYVAMERVIGTLHGKRGTFALQHSGTMAQGSSQMTIAVVPGSGTDQLTGISGKLAVTVTGGKHFYEFEYSFAGI